MEILLVNKFSILTAHKHLGPELGASPLTHACTCAQSLSRVQVFVVSWTEPGSPVHGISQARILEWVAVPGDLPNPGVEPSSPALTGRFFTLEPPGTPREWGLTVCFMGTEFQLRKVKNL